MNTFYITSRYAKISILEVLFMSERVKLFLDLDDTVKDTERYIRKVFASNGLQYDAPGSIYRYINSGTVEDSLIRECFYDWNVIPFKDCALNGIKLLQTEYDVIFCTTYTFNKEAQMKKSLAKTLGCDIILCGDGNRYKDKVDMSGGIFVDDRADILLRSNADIKFELYSPYYFDGYAERDDKTLIVDWYSLIDILMNKGIDTAEVDKKGGILYEKFGRLLCAGV